jgi:hypothetical protein
MGFDSGTSHIVSHRSTNWAKEDLLLHEPTTIIITLDKRSNKHLSVIFKVIVLASSAVNHEFEPLSGQNKNYTNGICCFSAKHVALRRKSKDWLAQN